MKRGSRSFNPGSASSSRREVKYSSPSAFLPLHAQGGGFEEGAANGTRTRYVALVRIRAVAWKGHPRGGSCIHRLQEAICPSAQIHAAKRSSAVRNCPKCGEDSFF